MLSSTISIILIALFSYRYPRIVACWDLKEPAFVLQPVMNAIPKYLGCFNTSQYMIDKNFTTFLNRRLVGQTSKQCLEWCLSQIFKPRLRSIFALHGDRCICTRWKPNDLPHIDVNEIDDRYCEFTTKELKIIPWTSRIITLYMFCQEMREHATFGDIQLKTMVTSKTTVVVSQCASVGPNYYPPTEWIYSGTVGSVGQTPVYECFRQILDRVKPDCNDYSEHEIKSQVIEAFVILGPSSKPIYYDCHALAYDEPLEFPLQYLNESLENCALCEVSAMIPMKFGNEEFYCGNKEAGIPALVSIYSRTIKISDVCGFCDIVDGSPQTTLTTTSTTSCSTTESTTEIIETTTQETQDTLPEETPPSGGVQNQTMTTKAAGFYGPDSPSGTGICDTAHCKVTDMYGTEWCANIGQTVQRLCVGNATGTSSWKCTLSGFEGSHPNFSKCRSVWLETLITHVAQNTSHPLVEAIHFLNIIRNKCKVSEEQGESPLPPPYYPHEIQSLFELATNIVLRVNGSVSISAYEMLSYSGVDVMRQVMVNQNPWDVLGDEFCSVAGTSFVLGAEKSMLELTRRVASNDSWMNHNIRYRKNYGRFEMNMTSGTQVVRSTQNEAICYPFPCDERSENFIRLPDDWAKYFTQCAKVRFVGSEMLTNYTNKIFPGKLLNETLISPGNQTKVINGKLMTFSIDSTLSSMGLKSLDFVGEGVTIGFQHEVVAWGSQVKKIRRSLHPGEVAKPVMGTATCVYWNTNSFKWSSEGCAVVSTGRHSTTCKCLHLSSFAVLFSVHEYVGKNPILEILTWILSSLSSICLLICILILSMSRTKSSRSPRNEITVHLCFNLFAGNILLLLFMDKHYFNLGVTMCAISGVMIHFFFLSAFCWMTIEAFQLYRMVIVVFDSGNDYKLIQRILAYGIPTLIIIATLVAGAIRDFDAYGGEEFCWLQEEYIWTFMGPVAVLLTINLVILLLCLRKAQQLKAGMKKNSGFSKAGNRPIRSWIKGTASLTCLLGLCWISGFFMVVSPDSKFAESFAFIFTILNASQGFLLFVFHFAMNSQVQSQIKERFGKWVRISQNSGCTHSVSTLGLFSNSASSSCSDANDWQTSGQFGSRKC